MTKFLFKLVLNPDSKIIEFTCDDLKKPVTIGQVEQFLSDLRADRQASLGDICEIKGDGPGPQRTRLIDYIETFVESYKQLGL